MKKVVASIATGIILTGATMTTASAEEYQVEKGDNLWSIAENYDVTVDELVDNNELNTTTIQPKQTLTINNEETRYTVEKGDTLYGISHEFDVAVDDLKGWNNLNSDIITIGQNLDIKGVEGDEDEKETGQSSESQNKAAETSKKQSASEDNTSNEAEAAQKTSNNKSEDKPNGKTISMNATAYTADCDGCSGITATGVDLNANPNKKVVAVDPSVIPLGSEVHVEGYGRAVAADTGGAINGNRIDLHVASTSEANSFGRQNVEVTVIN